MKRVASVIALAAAMLVGAGAAEAQMPVRFGLAGGLSMPSGDINGFDIGDVWDNGFHGQAMIQFGITMLPAKLRADIGYTSFGGKTGFPDLRIISGALNANVGLGGIGLKPYISGGLGMYNSKVDDPEDDESDTDFGINGGVGLEFSLTGMSTFLEVRYIKIFVSEEPGEDASFAVIPITFGIIF